MPQASSHRCQSSTHILVSIGQTVILVPPIYDVLGLIYEWCHFTAYPADVLQLKLRAGLSEVSPYIEKLSTNTDLLSF